MYLPSSFCKLRCGDGFHIWMVSVSWPDEAGSQAQPQLLIDCPYNTVDRQTTRRWATQQQIVQIISYIVSIQSTSFHFKYHRDRHTDSNTDRQTRRHTVRFIDI